VPERIYLTGYIVLRFAPLFLFTAAAMVRLAETAEAPPRVRKRIRRDRMTGAGGRRGSVCEHRKAIHDVALSYEIDGKKGEPRVSGGATRNGRTPFPPYFSHNAAKLTSQKRRFVANADGGKPGGGRGTEEPAIEQVPPALPFPRNSKGRSIDRSIDRADRSAVPTRVYTNASAGCSCPPATGIPKFRHRIAPL